MALMPARPATRAFWAGLIAIPFACICPGVVLFLGVLVQMGADQTSDPASARVSSLFLFAFAVGLLVVLGVTSLVLINSGRPRGDTGS